MKVTLLLIALVLTFAGSEPPKTHTIKPQSNKPIRYLTGRGFCLIAQRNNAIKQDVSTWWNLHIRGFRPDRSRRWDPLGQVRDMPGLVEEARDRPLPPPPNLIPPIDTRMPQVPPATPVPLPVPGLP